MNRRMGIVGMFCLATTMVVAEVRSSGDAGQLDTASANSQAGEAQAAGAGQGPGPGNDTASTGGTSAEARKMKAKAAGGGKPLVITPEREAAAMTFVRQHHPELAELLTLLKASSPGEFERAMRDLFRTSERLAQFQERDSLTYELELSLWKARSRIQLLSARLHMSDDEGLRNELRTALSDEFELRTRVMQHDREKLAERVKNLDAQLDRMRSNRERAIGKQYETIIQAARRADSATGGKSAKKKSSKATGQAK
jgi:hypothetical protein